MIPNFPILIRVFGNMVVNTVYVEILADIKFGNLAPNWAFKIIGGILIWRSAKPSWQKSLGANYLAEFNLQIQASIAKPPNLISHQYFHLYGILWCLHTVTSQTKISS